MSFFSVIIPVYNCEKYLTDAVNSVRRQPVKDIEIILVDDGSTDSSGEICLRLADEDKNIKVFSQINKGASAARNTGLDHAAGEYVMFLDADDIYVNNAVDQEILNECRKGYDVIFRADRHIRSPVILRLVFIEEKCLKTATSGLTKVYI